MLQNSQVNDRDSGNFIFSDITDSLSRVKGDHRIINKITYSEQLYAKILKI